MLRRGRTNSLVLAFVVAAAAFVAACGSGGLAGIVTPPAAPLKIVSGSENETLEPIVQRFARQNNTPIEVTYLGSVDISLALEQGAEPYDAVWPANSLWISLGDRQRKVSSTRSIMRSPVVIGVKRSVAQRLNWVGRDVKVADVLAAAESGQLRYMMTSATQSNSGASAYFGFLYAFAGNPEVLTSATLREPAVQEKIKRILGAVNRSSGSSGWLKTLFLDKYTDFDAMVNYESVIIETNQELVRTGREPLYAIYPSDGLAISDSPLGFIDRGDPKKADTFQKLQTYLLSEPIQQEIFRLGRRVGVVGITPQGVDTNVFNPAWGIDASKELVTFKFPAAEVIRDALDLYQTSFRKASFTVYGLDFSGSMGGSGEAQLKTAMRSILDQNEARRNLLQAAPDDITHVILFNSDVFAEYTVVGNDPAQLLDLWRKIDATRPSGGTNIYAPVVRGNAFMVERKLGDRFPSIILLTDGESNNGSFNDVSRRRLNDVPIYGLLFGSASRTQLDELTKYTSGRVFDGRQNLADAFRTAKGYN